MTGRADTLRDLLITACAVSAGIHAALVPAHYAEGAAAGAAFAASAAVLGVLAVALTRNPSRAATAVAAATFAGLLVAYAMAITTGVPLLHPEPEPIDGLALFTKAVEVVGLVAATDLLRPKGVYAWLPSRPARFH
jgi:hypothetical protein